MSRKHVNEIVQRTLMEIVDAYPQKKPCRDKKKETKMN